MRKTSEQKRIEQLELEVSELQKDVKAAEDNYNSKSEICDAYFKQLNKSEGFISDLRGEITNLHIDRSKLLKEIETFNNPDQSKMTIHSGRQLLLDAFAKIECPITRKESFKQFVATVSIESKKESVELQKKAILCTNISTDINNWLVNTGREEVVIP